MKKVFYPLACCCLAAGVFCFLRWSEKKQNAQGRTEQSCIVLL